MSELTLPFVVREAERRFADRTAVEEAERHLTFAELASSIRQASASLIALGVERGDRVAIWAPNRLEWIVAALGTAAAGGVLVPINTRFKAQEAGYVLEKCRARVLFSVAEFLGTDYVELLVHEYGKGTGARPIAGLLHLQQIVLFDAPREGLLGWHEFLALARSVTELALRKREASVGPDDLSDILFTSGTTGRPKGVMTTHHQNIRAFTAWSDVVGLREDDRYLILNPFFHAFGYKAGILACLLRGATMLPERVFDVARVLERIGRDRISVLPGPPTLYQSLLAHPKLAEFDISGLRLAVTGAASIPVTLIRRMKDELGFDTVITGYGLTEACGIATMCRFDDDPETIATTSGRAIPDVEVKVFTGDGSEAEPGQLGEVKIRGYNVMRGYFEDPEQTRDVIDDSGFLATGDIGILDERGYLRITDRKKDLFIVGGFNCYPAEIENFMLQNRNISQAAVVGVPDERLGEVGMAFVVLRPGTGDGAACTSAELIAWCRERMANYKVPRHVEIVSALPVNAAGKLVKEPLRERARVRLSTPKA